MHRNLYGPGGQLLPHFESLWAAIAPTLHLGTKYPPEKWAEGFVLRPALGIYTLGYTLVLIALRHFRWGWNVKLHTLLIVTGLVAIPFLLMPYLMSSDLFDYTSYARLWVIHDSNPYMSTISEYPNDIFFPITCWKVATSVYGPAYTLLTIAFVHIGEALGGSVTLYILIHRAAMLGFQLVSGTLIWKILSEARAADRGFKTAAFLLNPLVMLEFPGNGHNEAMMISFLLAAVMMAQKNQSVLAAVMFAFAVQTKLYCLPLFFFYVALRCWKAKTVSEAVRRTILLTGVLAIISVILYLPFGLTASTILAPLQGPGGSSTTKSLGDYLVYKAPIHLDKIPAVGVLFRGNKLTDMRRVALIATFIVCAAGAFYARSLSRAVSAMAFFALFWCAVGATWFMPWYVTFAVAFAVISPSRSTAAASGLLSLSVFTIYLLEGWNFSQNPDTHNFMVGRYELFVFLPPMLFFAALQAWEFYVGRKRIDTLPPKIYGT